MYYKQAVKLKEGAQQLFRQVRRDLETVIAGGQPGPQTPESAPVEPDVPQQPQAALPDTERVGFSYLTDTKRREADPLEVQLTKLEDLLRQVKKMSVGQLRMKRTKMIKEELAKVKSSLLVPSAIRATGARSRNNSAGATKANRARSESASDGSRSSSSSSTSSSSPDSSADSGEYFLTL